MRERMDYDKPDYVTHEEESEEYLNELRLTPEAMARYLSMMELIPTLEMPLDAIPDPEVLLEQSDNDRPGNYETEYRVSESERYEEQGGVHHQEQFETDDGGQAEHGDRYQEHRRRARGRINGSHWAPPDVRNTPTLVFLEMPDPRRAKPRERERHPGDTPEAA